MFAHAEATKQKDHDHAIFWGHQQPSPKWDVNADVPTINLMGYKTTQEEIWRLHNEVYQLKRAPGAEPCNVETAETSARKILNSVKEHLNHMWGPTQSTEVPGQRSTSTPLLPHSLSSNNGSVRHMPIFGI